MESLWLRVENGLYAGGESGGGETAEELTSVVQVGDGWTRAVAMVVHFTGIAALHHLPVFCWIVVFV